MNLKLYLSYLFIILYCYIINIKCENIENQERDPFTQEKNQCFLDCQAVKEQHDHPEWEKYPTYLAHKNKLNEQTLQVKACMSKFRPHGYHGNITASDECLEFAEDVEENPVEWDTLLFGRCLDSCSHYVNITSFQTEIQCMHGCANYSPKSNNLKLQMV